MKAWKKRTPAEGNDYAAFKVFWEQAIRIADKSIATPAIQYEYGMTITDDHHRRRQIYRVALIGA
jgi:hypothetical protein